MNNSHTSITSPNIANASPYAMAPVNAPYPPTTTSTKLSAILTVFIFLLVESFTDST